MIAQGYVTYLLTQSTIKTLVDTRISPQMSQQGNGYPRITYLLVSAPYRNSLQGALGVRTARIQTESRSHSYIEAKQLCEALRLVLDGYRGPMGSFMVQRCILDDTNEHYEPPTDASDSGVYVVSFDVRITFNESIPLGR